MLKHSRECRNHREMRSVAFYGGGKKWDQLRLFGSEGAHIVVATPGRLLDFVGDGKISLKRVTYLVLDEADRMLELGFRGDMEQIASAIRPERQTAFFSATWSQEIQGVASTFATEAPVTIRVGQAGGAGDDKLTARKGIKQEVVVVDFPQERKPWIKQAEKKNELLEVHIKQAMANDKNKMILFVNSKMIADELADKLYKEGIYCDTLHGGRPQEKRLSVLDEFRKGKTQLLIATDVMGRGLDVEGVTHVVVYEMGGVEDYIHRIGRTGRGKDGKGHALVFFEFSDKYPDWAKGLIEVLEKSEQPVPDDLRKIAADVAAGKRGWTNGGGGWGGGGSWGGNGWKRGGSWEDKKKN
jgi:ATP-dependent RNA helicase DDX5/DBP2